MSYVENDEVTEVDTAEGSATVAEPEPARSVEQADEALHDWEEAQDEAASIRCSSFPLEPSEAIVLTMPIVSATVAEPERVEADAVDESETPNECFLRNCGLMLGQRNVVLRSERAFAAAAAFMKATACTMERAEEAIMERVGCKRRTVQYDIEIGRDLTVEARDALRGTKLSGMTTRLLHLCHLSADLQGEIARLVERTRGNKESFFAALKKFPDPKAKAERDLEKGAPFAFKFGQCITLGDQKFIIKRDPKGDGLLFPITSKEVAS